MSKVLGSYRKTGEVTSLGPVTVHTLEVIEPSPARPIHALNAVLTEARVSPKGCGGHISLTVRDSQGVAVALTVTAVRTPDKDGG